MTKFLPNIDDHLDLISDNLPIEINELDDLIYKIIVHTGLSYDICKIIVREYFQVMRNDILKGNIFHVENIGKIYISCPKNKHGPIIKLMIKPFKKFKNKIKYE